VPWNGINAISGARQLLAQLEGLDLKVPTHHAFGPATLTPTAIESSPKATHTVPDEVRITFDRRLLPGETPDGAFDQIRAAIMLREPWDVEYRRGPVMYPNEIATRGLLFRKLNEAFSKAGKGPPEPLYCNFALDAGYFGRQGIEAVMLGPGEVEQFHSDEEHVLVSDFLATTGIYYELMKRCLSEVDDALTPAPL
jgi:acetylornithine deacetylase